MKRYYIATTLSNWEQHNYVRDKLGRERITYDWTLHGPVWNQGYERMEEVAHLEFYGCRNANLIIGLLPGGRGTHVEIGIGLALGIPIMLYSSQPEHFIVDPATSVFYYHEGVILRTNDLEELIKNAQIKLC